MIQSYMNYQFLWDKMIGYEPRSPVDLKYIFFWRHNFVFVTLTEDTSYDCDQTVVTFTSIPACTGTADSEGEGERRVGVARGVRNYPGRCIADRDLTWSVAAVTSASY